MDQGVLLTPMPGDPQMGKVYDSTVAYAALTKNTAQFQQVDPAGAAVSNGEGRIPTYSIATAALAPTSVATDVMTITGSSLKVVRIKRVGVSGRATSAGQVDVLLYKHTVLNTSGVSVSLSTLVTPHDTTINAAAPAATILTYSTAFPVIDTSKTLVRAQQSNLSAAGSGGAATPFELHFGDVNDQSLVLRGSTEQMAINLNGSVPVGAIMNLFIEWSEE